ncbi:lactate utilization protein [Parashewanella curva]|uniref:Lactate utilization protein n=1 Tax=Parashewanella curva TaxID=2338552 RepID=A0A3L8PXV9_9GAMM|nr:lactate utilization protein [Parashewanella curva]RLV60095.1 lactate utilization protein [Parashewanella curva]
MSTKTELQQLSSKSKSSILAKLKAQVSGADYSKLPVEMAYEYPELSHQQQLELFTNNLTANHAQVINTSKESIERIVAEELSKRNLNKILIGTNSEYKDGLSAQLEVQEYDFDLQQNKPYLFNEVAASLSTSLCSIAQTGTIVLWPDENEPRTLSLVPPVHFVIVDAQKLYPSFSDVLVKQKWQQNMPTNIVFISGPSKTADIQQTLAYGAHGPKELVVLLINV